MKNWWKKNCLWLSVYLMALLLCVVILLTASKYDIHKTINGINTSFLDQFFCVITEFGAFSLIATITVITLFFRFRLSLTILASSLFAVVFTQLGKRVIWPDSPRPKVLFEGLDSFHVVEGVHLHNFHSFPSGHTSGAFALFAVLALYAKTPWQKLLFLVAAFSVAYSRMYLSQHFLVDVTAGSFIGVVSALLAFWWMNASAYKEKKGLDMRLTLRRPWIG